MTSRPEPRFSYIWHTINAIPAPDGYVNIYNDENGKPLIGRCPAFLVMEHRPIWTANYDELTRDEMEREGINPHALERRVVAADLDGGTLVEADDASNFAGTFHRDDLDSAEA